MKPYHTNSLTCSLSCVMHSLSSSRIAVIWGRGELAWGPLLRGAAIASPCYPSVRVGVWCIIEVLWGGTCSKCFTILPPRQPPPISSLAGAADSAASALRSGLWGGTATPRGIVASPPPLARFSEAWPRAEDSFAATSSSLLPQDYLVGPCHEREFTFLSVKVDDPPPSCISCCTTP